MKPLLIYITASTKQEAEQISEILIKKKLASCVNILPEIQSHYIWNGKLQKEKEVLMLVKTFDAKYKQVESTIKKIHSYETPCIVAIPIIKGNEAYLRWSKQCM
ncbi:hypothetical protein COV18_06845 [Candidatus Woesearchaeota archaeon CG10_big_fil_rev_8_21_14_0_10_37_12]|nr:MAG: hypothetical protein COV18_06845 [Candidatus Woesearchaeota archaeon CG10_big_fil_rev_8_21_14_0_10_37_12]